MKKLSVPSHGLLETVRQKYMPEQWFFGHLHIYAEGSTDGCSWECLDIFSKGGVKKIWLEWQA